MNKRFLRTLKNNYIKEKDNLFWEKSWTPLKWIAEYREFKFEIDRECTTKENYFLQCYYNNSPIQKVNKRITLEEILTNAGDFFYICSSNDIEELKIQAEEFLIEFYSKDKIFTTESNNNRY